MFMFPLFLGVMVVWDCQTKTMTKYLPKDAATIVGPVRGRSTSRKKNPCSFGVKDFFSSREGGISVMVGFFELAICERRICFDDLFAHRRDLDVSFSPAQPLYVIWGLLPDDLGHSAQF
jgi:hypothetical protein